ncbi:MAG: L,D-transpeptidase [Hyphomicrobium sp.]|uniref:L,D-transpeptidase n=1 Tax=Hyphomicrobium sp. TaxID=82 RepID=UPI003D134B26
MRLEVLVGGLAIVAITAGSVMAADAKVDASQNGVPTVTIINKAPLGSTAPAPPTLAVSPSADEVRSTTKSPSAPAAPEAAATAEVEDGVVEGEGSPMPDPEAAAAAAAAVQEPAPRPEPTLAIDIDLSRQSMTVTENGALLHTWPVSSARYGYRTPTGTFEPTWMSKMWYSRQYGYAPMPHAIFFHQGVAIHGTYATRALGRPASHGCVRLAPMHAAALYKLVGAHTKARTRIVVHGTASHGAEVAYDEPRTRRMRGDEPVQLRRGTPAYRYLPPSYYGRKKYSAYAPPPGYYAPRTRRSTAALRRPPRGLYGGYGYGF